MQSTANLYMSSNFREDIIQAKDDGSLTLILILLVIGAILIIWMLRLMYYSFDHNEKKRFRIVETANNEFRIEKLGLYIPIWYTRLNHWNYKITIPADSSDGQKITCKSLVQAQNYVLKCFIERDKEKKDQTIISKWVPK